ncbi:uncharacterized protein LTR77_005337 [Saxophila tyrrhenica]|uniref:Uncharacterized protein n=1 Tax=Saxophila tyrrhenica TaxID=1690608 RepID=A0AAV9P8T5_9PEZI|nr:hypothetical protein LTR77_005337 [Saxophila tyrrhenica]
MSPSDGDDHPNPLTRMVSPSPARDSLRSNLDVAEGTSTLKKKRSWMAGLRDAVSKSALHAKAAVDSFRGDQQKAESTAEPDHVAADAAFTGLCHQPEPKERLSHESEASKADSVSSVTSLRPQHGRQRSLASRIGTASLRQHLRNHSHAHSKRSSVYSIVANDEHDCSPAGPELFATTSSPPAGKPGAYKRHESVAKGVIGSIRGIRRKGTSDSLAPPLPDLDTPGVSQARRVPLPSSPIPIPALAPALDLDLGPSGFSVSPPRSFTNTRSAKGSTSVLPSGKGTFGPTIEDGSIQSRRRGPLGTGGQVRPRDLLQIDTGSFNFELPPGPPTPMPGTNLPLEIDGANGEMSQMFERSVTPPSAKERKWLRTMRSLDAMAEAYAAAPKDTEATSANSQSGGPSNDLASRTPKFSSGTATDSCSPTQPQPKNVQLCSTSSLEAMAEASTIAHRNDELELQRTVEAGRELPNSTPASPQRRNATSAETVHTLPSDMESLSRQRAYESPPRSHVPGTGEVDCMPVEDPFKDDKAVGSGPPSPDRSVTLPFRPKASQVSHDASATQVTRNARTSTTEEPEANKYVFTQTVPTSPATSLALQMELQRNYDMATRYEYAEQSKNVPLERESFEDEDPFENRASDDDTCMGAQELLTYGIILPNYSFDSLSGGEGMSPHGGPLASNLPAIGRHDENSSPPSSRSCNRYTAGASDAQYRFSVNNWLREPPTTHAPDDEQATPRRRGAIWSSESVSSNEERKTPEISPSTTNPDRTPSMGNRLEFDLKRSNRNMRYNALHQGSTAESVGARCLSGRSQHRFLIGCSEDADENDLQLSDFNTAYDVSTEALPGEAGKATEARMNNRDSVTESMMNAAHDYGQLRRRLEEVEDVFADPAGVSEDPFRSPEMTELGGVDPHDRWVAEASALVREVEGAGAESQLRDATDRCFGRASPAVTRLLEQTKLRFAAPESAESETTEQLESPVVRILSPTEAPPTSFPSETKRTRMVSDDTLDASLELYSRRSNVHQSHDSSAAEEVELED